MPINLSQSAISAALSGNWQEAEKLNKEILKTEPKDTDALNRLARAFSEQGKKAQAIKTAEKVLKIDTLDQIAQKSIKRWKSSRSKDLASTITNPNNFFEEPGKTKIVQLINLGDSKITLNLECGDKILLDLKKHRVSVTATNGKYIGRLPDDLSNRLIKLTHLGNTYEACIKSAGHQTIEILIKETYRSNLSAQTPSFPIS